MALRPFSIDRVDDQARSTYVAFANTAMGGMALCFGGLGVVAQVYGFSWVMRLLVLSGAFGGLLGLGLPDTQRT